MKGCVRVLTERVTETARYWERSQATLCVCAPSLKTRLTLHRRSALLPPPLCSCLISGVGEWKPSGCDAATHTHTQSSQLYFIYNRKYFLAVHLAIVSPSPSLFFSTTSVAISLSPFYPISDFTASLSALRRKTLRQKENEDTQQLHYSSIQRTKKQEQLVIDVGCQTMGDFAL